jgi:hypothetical protein
MANPRAMKKSILYTLSKLIGTFVSVAVGYMIKAEDSTDRTYLVVGSLIAALLFCMWLCEYYREKT